MEYTVTNESSQIDWNASGDDRILQNVNNILNTFQNEIPYDRLCGRNPDNLDSSTERMINNIIEETYDLIANYETRVTVKDVKAAIDNGELKLEVVVDID